jgi:prephenate dehydrogenase
VLRTAADHDRAVALVSHVPQLVASALASRLVDAPDDDVALTGQALRDLTRIADSDPKLWAGIAMANAGAIGAELRALVEDLAAAARALGALQDLRLAEGESIDRQNGGLSTEALPGTDSVADLVARGRAGRARLPGRHGGSPTRSTTVTVVVPDRPGELSRMLGQLAHAQVNVDDLVIDHAAGQPTGVVDVAVAPDAAERALTVLRAAGWSAHRAEPPAAPDASRAGRPSGAPDDAGAHRAAEHTPSGPA